MTFRETYTKLECDFRDQVERDNKELGIASSYVPNFLPPGPVDYVLIAMEPSTGVPGKKIKSLPKIPRNFSWSVEDFILHYCVKKYLCQDGETYHLTDLAKGGMTIASAKKEPEEKYKRWYPLLKDELRLLNKPGRTRLIAVGNVVADFLEDKGLCERVEKILHYTRTAASHRNKAIQPWGEHYDDFSRTVNKDAFERSIREVLNDADMGEYISYRPEGGKLYELTESRKKLMFCYKNRFGELRNTSHIILNLEGV